MTSRKADKISIKQKPELDICEYLGDKVRLKLESSTGKKWTVTGRLNQLDIEMIFNCSKFSKKVKWNVFDIKGPFDPETIDSTFKSMIEHDFSVVLEAYNKKINGKVISEN